MPSRLKSPAAIKSGLFTPIGEPGGWAKLTLLHPSGPKFITPGPALLVVAAVAVACDLEAGIPFNNDGTMQNAANPRIRTEVIRRDTQAIDLFISPPIELLHY